MSAKKIVEPVIKGEFTYKDLPIAAMIPVPATSLEYKTGIWRTRQPRIDSGKCIKCLLCWVFCPDAAVKRLEDDSIQVDYDYCKGCGICETVCPVKAISMEEV